MQTLTIITGNPNKIREIVLGLPEYHIDHIALDLPEIQSLDTREIIKEKLLAAANQTDKRPLLVEDVSLTLAHFDHKLPGPLIKWFLTGPQKSTYLLRLLPDHAIREAIGYCTVGLLLAGGEIHYFTGSTKGSICTEERGDTTFGFDPLFIPQGDHRTYAEMDMETKNSYSPRGKALTELRTTLPTLLI